MAGPRTFKFSTFASQYEMHPEAAELSWTDLKTLFSDFAVFEGDKGNELHFNGCHFHTPNRLQDNVEALHILVLDFDDGMPLEEAREHFKQYQHLGYTSYNHQVSKKGAPPVDKYRILIPLTEPCPLKEWKAIRHNVATFAPGVDMSCIRLHQPFAVPMVRPGLTPIAWNNEGIELDWTTWEHFKTEPFKTSKANPILRSEHILLPDDTLQTKKGPIRVGDITVKVNGILCPFHGAIVKSGVCKLNQAAI